MYLSGDRLYTETDETLKVFLLSDLTSPIAIYQVDCVCFSGIIADNHIYIGGDKKLQVFEMNTSLTQPLLPVKVIDTKESVFKILRAGHELILGEEYGYL